MSLGVPPKCATLDERFKLLVGAEKMQNQLMAAFKSDKISSDDAKELRRRQNQLIDLYLEQSGLKSANVEDPLQLEDELDMHELPPQAHAALFHMEEFLARLSANLISAISHIVTPPSVLPMPLAPPKPKSLQEQSTTASEEQTHWMRRRRLANLPNEEVNDDAGILFLRKRQSK
jgi:hypothetical protein